MRVLISDEYRDLNQRFHAENKGFGTKAYKYAQAVARIALASGAKSILDYGCGKGTLKVALAEVLPSVRVEEYDPAVRGKDGDPKTEDMVIVFDVMEHVEPEHLDDVIQHIQSKARKTILFKISNVRARKQLPDGRNAHLIVEDKQWWQTKIKQYCSVREIIDAGNECIIACVIE